MTYTDNRSFATARRLLLPITVLFSFLTGCSPTDSSAPRFVCDGDNGGLLLPEGFCAGVVADQVGRARHIAVRDNGDIYVALRSLNRGSGMVGLRDLDADGRMDQTEYFGIVPGTGVKIRNGFLYQAADHVIVRYRLSERDLIPAGPGSIVTAGFPEQRGHATKPFEFDGAGNILVNIGAPSNACQEPQRTPGVAGLDPCPLLERHGGVWRFDYDPVSDTYAQSGVRYATGIRNGVANAWNPFTGKLYVVQHGRDQLSTLWPDIYSEEQNAELPAEELFEVDEGDDFGWPYCYYDHLQEKKVLSPEYGGDGTKAGRCAETEDPIAAFPGHWAPNDILFYDGDMFPERYREGAFIAFHGSWNRSPLEQAGYNVVFLPFEDGAPAGDYEVFADGFTGEGPINSTSDADHRPMGLAVGPDGSLYVTDSAGGRIWRIISLDADAMTD